MNPRRFLSLPGTSTPYRRENPFAGRAPIPTLEYPCLRGISLVANTIFGGPAGSFAHRRLQSSTASDSALDRRIEVSVRNQFSIPEDYNVALGARKPSSFTGYDELPVTLSRGGHSQVVNFLISSDNTKLARLETFDLTKNPASDIDVADRPVRGNPDAKVTVVSFDDLECPYCARMHQSLFPATLNRYKDQVRFVYKDFPLTEIHPWAMHASVDANCLAAQSGGVYWS